jgi:4-amino-4-deoxy-L-arabinose transferase-like glycosyltransferase
MTHRRYPHAILCAYLILALLYSAATPLWEAPDEVGHWAYVEHLLRYRALPVLREGETGEAHQPPLYYVLAALAALPADIDDPTTAFRPNPDFIWAGQGDHPAISLHGSAETFPYRGRALAFRLARGVSIICGMATVALTLAMGRRIFPRRPALAWLAGGLVALNPQFLYISGVLNNDALLIALSTGALWQMLRLLERANDTRGWLALGVCIALAALTKTAGFTLLPIAGLALIYCAARRRSLRLLIVGGACLAVPVALLTGWWFARNMVLYGDPLGWDLYRRVFAANLRHTPVGWADLRLLGRVQFRSFWGLFGWMTVPAPERVYSLYAAICAIAGISLVIQSAIALRRRAVSLDRLAAFGLLGFAGLTQQGYVLMLSQSHNQSVYQGRYLFPAIAPLALAAAVGLTGPLPTGRVAQRVTVSLSLSLLAVALYIPLGVIAPAYTGVVLPKRGLWRLDHPLEYTFDGGMELRGVRLDEQVDDARVSVTLYWRAAARPDFDYSAFVHLIDEAGQIVAQSDQSPGEAAGYPPTVWWPGDIMVDIHDISFPPTLVPGIYRLRVGLYRWDTGEQLAVSAAGQDVGRYAVLDPPVVRVRTE